MFLGRCNFPELESIPKLAKETTTYNAFYVYWKEQLFERVMRLFVWENTNEVPAKEIEQRLIIAGHCGITKDKKGELSAFFGNFHGVTKYYDEWTQYNVHCPVWTATKTIGKDIVVINNNALRNPILPLIHHYAVLLAHTDVSLVMQMVNSRQKAVPIAKYQNQKQSIMNYLGKLYNGQLDAITDPAGAGVNYLSISSTGTESIVNLEQTKEKILKSFYSDIGVRSALEKRSNAVESEVEADTPLLLLNLSDMIASRKEAAEEVNAMFGTNWKVTISPEIEIGLNKEGGNNDEKDSERNV